MTINIQFDWIPVILLPVFAYSFGFLAGFTNSFWFAVLSIVMLIPIFLTTIPFMKALT